MYRVNPIFARTVREAWATYLDEVVGEDLAALEGPERHECLQGVAAYCEGHASGLEDGAIRPLLRRALEAVFGPRAADEWVHGLDEEPARLPATASAELKDLCLADVLRAIPSPQGEARWRLRLEADARKLGPGSDMLWFARVRKRMDQVAGLWDLSRGRGGLVLGGLRRSARAMAGRESQNTASFCRETLAFARDVMQEHARRRGWDNSPFVESGDLF